MNVMKWYSILHPSSVVSEHMTSPSKAMKLVNKYFKGTSVTYSGCSDLVLVQFLQLVWTKGDLP